MDRDPELRSGRLLFRFDQLPEGVELPAPRVFAELRSVRRAGLSGRVSRIPRTWLREVRRTDLESPIAGGRIARRQESLPVQVTRLDRLETGAGNGQAHL